MNAFESLPDYSQRCLMRATVNMVKRIKRENPELWAQIQEEAKEAEARKDCRTSCASSQ